jgi:hypothetical protein
MRALLRIAQVRSIRKNATFYRDADAVQQDVRSLVFLYIQSGCLDTATWGKSSSGK